MRLLLIVFCMGVLSLAPNADAQQQPPASFADLVERLSPAVVNISTTQKVKQAQGVMGLPFALPPGMEDDPQLQPFREFFDRFGQQQGKEAPQREVYSLGSGVIIDAKGYVVTNNHVIDGAEEIKVIFSNNDKYDAKLIGRDPKTDLALLKIEAKKDLPFVTLGDSDAMRVGDWVIAIGNPFGLGGSVTQGIISARQRSINAGPFDDFLQTDAPINRGNSGGPLFNTKGEVIGINTAIFSPSGGSVGIGFAIPTALARPVLEQLKASGKVQRGWLGVKIQEVSDDIANSVGMDKAKGALVLEVSKDSPAGKVGIQAGDIITHFDGKEVSEMRFLPRMVAEAKIGKTVDITYLRGGKSMTAKIAVGELDEKAEEADDSKPNEDKAGDKVSGGEEVLGLELAPISPSLRQRFRLDDALSGVLVVGVKDDSEMAKRGVRAGDVIRDVNGEAVKTAADVKKAFDAAKKQGRKFALVKIRRGKDDAFVPLPVGEEKK